MDVPAAKRRSVISATLAVLIVASAGLALLPAISPGPGTQLAQMLPASSVQAEVHGSYAVTSPLDLIERPRVVLERGTISVDTGSERSTGRALFALLTGGGANLSLVDASISIDMTHSPDEEVGLAAAAAPLAKALAAHSFSALAVRNSTLMIRAREESDDQVVEQFSGDFTLGRTEALRAAGRFRYRDEELTYVAAVSAPKANGEQIAVRGSLDGALVKASLDGRLRLSGRTELTSDSARLAVEDVRSAARWLGSDWPQGNGLKTFNARGPFSWSGGTVSFEQAEFEIDGNRATGGISLALHGKRPAIEGTLAFDRLDLDPYVSDPTRSSALARATDWVGMWLVPFAGSRSLIAEVDADLRLSGSNVGLMGQPIARGAASVSVRDGKLFADLAEIELETGGTGQGQISADVTGSAPRYTLRGRLDGAEIGRTISARLGQPVLDGVGSAVFDFEGEGHTNDQVLASLRGSLQFDLTDVAHFGVDLDRLAEAAASKSQQSGWSPILRGSRRAAGLTGKVTVDGGVFTADPVTLNLSGKDYLARGTINIPQRAIDIVVSAQSPLAERPGNGAAVPGDRAYRVRGPWSEPTIRDLGDRGKTALAPGRDE